MVLALATRKISQLQVLEIHDTEDARKAEQEEKMNHEIVSIKG